MRAKIQDTANNERQCNQVLRELGLLGDCATGWKMQFECRQMSNDLREGAEQHTKERTDYMNSHAAY